MPYCSFCGTELASDVRFCSDCGKPVSKAKSALNSDDIATIDINYEATATSSLPSTPPPSSSQRSASRTSAPAEYLISEGRFLPGRLIAGRYRIIALLGKGGMGEVYRADDLTLGQAVAMKFLPEEATSHEGMLERFKNEVRIARRVSHPNVCRVYDVGEVDGATFFTMEYVDGEDLASLLRRIGRLPQDKAVEIARQICAGLAAAHAKGVLHRDLKPANIMLDGRGQVVITDFGLAGVSDDIRGPEVRSGTPAYMAPEQLEGREVTMLSDIYALGLVLYEIFTGKRAFTEKPIGVLHAGSDRTPSRPSSVVRDIDPIVEKVILRCLEESPASRPPTALAISAALPGGDPLAAALAAGETPSPEMVAAAGETVGLRPRVAVICLAAILVAVGFIGFLGVHYGGLDRMRLEQTPEVLAQKAHEIVARLGYPDRPLDTAYGFDYDGDLQEAIEKNDKPRPDWNTILAGRPALFYFWYRQSPDYMYAEGYRDQFLNPGIVTPSDPPPTLSGMIKLSVDPQGRLIDFQAIPPQKMELGSTPVPYDWTPLFSEAGLDSSKFQKADPQWNSLAASDTRAAWTGVWPGTSRPLRVEASAFAGKPVYFSLIGDWTKPNRVKAPAESFGKKTAQILTICVFLSLLVGAVFLARRNYRHGRADREGAFRLAGIMFVLDMLLWLCRTHLMPSLATLGLLLIAVAGSLLVSAVTWILYLALEPWVRRRWPQTIISWSRLLSGQLRDPLVGRDILFGVMLGVVWILIFQLRSIPVMRLGGAPFLGNVDYLTGGRTALGAWLRQVAGSILGTLQFFFLLLGLKFVLRKDWLAAIAFVAIFAVPQAIFDSHPAIELPTLILVYSIAVLIVLRFGLIPLAVAIFTVDMAANLPLSGDLSAWLMTNSLLAWFSVLVLAGWGFYHSLGGQPIWKMEME
ncbi:MAG TPA: serine/threonine-protein kinase [Candidatus Binatia bacterium]|nr:serine/threonine-protein kinase [Candidatus Binatia bacterium]